MKSKLNPVSVGSFVIGGFILVAIGLISFQSLNFFHKPLRFISYFDEPVQGLDVGSTVRLRGVAVGRVIALKVHYDWEKKKSEVIVLSEVDKNVMTDCSGQLVKMSDPSILEKLVQDGLRAKIDLVGITGLKFIELDFLDPAKYAANDVMGKPDYPMIPTVDSGMSKITGNLVKIADKLSEVDFKTTVDDLKVLLNSLNETIEGVDLKKMVSQITGAAAAIQRLAAFLDQHPSSLIFGRKSATKACPKK